MLKTQYFAHRRPSTGIHLLTDPFPARLNGQTSIFERAENLAGQREYFAASRRFTAVIKDK